MHCIAETPFEDGTFKLVLQFDETYVSINDATFFSAKVGRLDQLTILYTAQQTPFSQIRQQNVSSSKTYHSSKLVVSLIEIDLMSLLIKNVYANGELCLDILQNRWSPTYDVAAILTSIQSLLHDPNPNSPANAEAANLYRENRKEYVRRVREIVETSWE